MNMEAENKPSNLSGSAKSSQISIGFVMEQALGHVTHHKNLARWTEEDATICPHWLPIPEVAPDALEKIPGIRNNWSLKASLRARAALIAAERKEKLDALFIHTQTCSLFSLPFMRRIPTVISLDATPLNYDTVGAEYGHLAGNDSWLDRRKMSWYKSVFSEAAAITTWCKWAKDSLVNDYGVPAEKISVIPPGVDLERWDFGEGKAERLQTSAQSPNAPLKLLFVGGDFSRKGGEYLLEAFRNELSGSCTLDLVTKDETLRDEAGIKVYRGLTANSAPLRDLYASADLFVFPTLGDCLPIAVMEAMAAGLPVITTDVGALSEEVEAGVNGLVIPPRDAKAISYAVQTLANDKALRVSMSSESRRLATERFSAKRNYGMILDLVKGVKR